MVDWKESLPPLIVTGTVPIRAALPNMPRLSRMSVPVEPLRLMAEAAVIVAWSVSVTAPPMLATPVKPKAFEKVCVPEAATRRRFRLPLMAPPKVVDAVEAKVSVAAVPEVLVMRPPPPGRMLADCRRSKAWLLPFRSSVPALAMIVCSVAPVPLVAARMVLRPPASWTVPPLRTKPFVPLAPVKYCGAAKTKVPSPALTMPCVVLAIAPLRVRVVAEPTTWRSIVMPWLWSCGTEMAEFASAKIPAALTVTAADVGVPATAVRLPPERSVSELSWTEPPTD